MHDGCVTSTFLDLAKPPRGPAPRTTAQALADLTRNPWQDVDAIYALTTLSDAYEPALERMPDAWTVTVKVNDTGDDAHLFAGLGNLTFDSRGYAWITNNTNQGTPFSGQFMVVLKPNGKPSDGINGTPIWAISSRRRLLACRFSRGDREGIELWRGIDALGAVEQAFDS